MKNFIEKIKNMQFSERNDIQQMLQYRNNLKMCIRLKIDEKISVLN